MPSESCVDGDVKALAEELQRMENIINVPHAYRIETYQQKR